MSFQTLFAISSQYMFAQDVRLDLVAGNLANTNVAAGDEQSVFRGRDVVLKTVPVGSSFGVTVGEIIATEKPATTRYQPDHPMADKEGIVFYPAVDAIEQFAAMVSAARSFETGVSLFATGRHMQSRVLELINV